MGSEWTVQDDAALAAKLAPVLGEAEVYHNAWVCRAGHRLMRWEYRCACGEPGSYRQHIPVTFTTPAVGWGLFERWHALPENVGCEVLIARNLRAPFLIQMQFSERDGRTERFGFAERILEALLVAWRGALDAEGDHA